MKASEIITKLSRNERTTLAALPGFPVKVGERVGNERNVVPNLTALGVVGPGGGLTIKGAAVVDRIKAESEPF